jgi:hypothetical protein
MIMEIKFAEFLPGRVPVFNRRRASTTTAGQNKQKLQSAVREKNLNLTEDFYGWHIDVFRIFLISVLDQAVFFTELSMQPF